MMIFNPLQGCCNSNCCSRHSYRRSGGNDMVVPFVHYYPTNIGVRQFITTIIFY